MSSVRLRLTGSWSQCTSGCLSPFTCARPCSRDWRANSAPSRAWRRDRCMLPRTRPPWTSASVSSLKESRYHSETSPCHLSTMSFQPRFPWMMFEKIRFSIICVHLIRPWLSMLTIRFCATEWRCHIEVISSITSTQMPSSTPLSSDQPRWTEEKNSR